MSANVKIDLLRGTTLVQSIAATTPNDGSHSWTIPGSLATGTNYRIRIKTVDNAVTAKSGQFTIN